MHEKDIELTRLLLKEYKERQGKAASLVEELSEAKQELDAVMDVRKEREGIHDVLSRAASLLEREDLGVELPDSAELEGSVSALEEKFSEIEADIAKYKGIVEELEEKAPELLKAARLDTDPAGGVNPESLKEEPQPNPKLASVEDVEGAEPSQAPIIDDASNEPAHAVLSKLNKRERAKLLKVFKLKALTEKEAYAHGRGAIYMVDTNSIFEQVKAYNYDSEADNTALHGHLALQFYALSLELSGSFHLVFNSTFPDGQNFGDLVAIDSVAGDKEAYTRRMRDLVASYSGKLRTVCLVTGDNQLAQAVDGQGAHIIPLGDFFDL